MKTAGKSAGLATSAPALTTAWKHAQVQQQWLGRTAMFGQTRAFPGGRGKNRGSSRDADGVEFRKQSVMFYASTKETSVIPPWVQTSEDNIGGHIPWTPGTLGSPQAISRTPCPCDYEQSVLGIQCSYK
ncbi:unnamed protein product [Ostreobium quekettii]|uniref:Uncharacterized protein n=1 Tax=Ostreobium quekettii TaxID=121088 RepID=A0A8S1IZR6_9CHLO|nr:unnamed protein product [Ostreobium quekettii]